MKSWDDPQCETPSAVPPRATVAANLEDALDDVTRKRDALVQITEQFADARARLQLAEDMALLGGKIDGSNDTIRGAQLRAATEDHRTKFQALDLQRAVASIGLEMALDRLKTYRVLAMLLAGEDR